MSNYHHITITAHLMLRDEDYAELAKLWVRSENDEGAADDAAYLVGEHISDFEIRSGEHDLVALGERLVAEEEAEAERLAAIPKPIPGQIDLFTGEAVS